ncbi:GNAT family N-acetyltransferase [Lentzea sp. BCCO 10_0061]|uniref:GNAT family N-acetyltransferase n=1 Tax=Lentzea sokolovensis TaxID=3095429 RepID=A0ABU4UT98_9PSEU|nr:GNAT family N-acetyltransferase [Lentzea sp. BCCO 10_0061]MDX8141935.1 GNAT family N-acetyltransferase [Lentzea sp. BCCO 10_0061]
MNPLDHAAHSALTGPHAQFAEHKGNVLRYPTDMSPFVALPPSPSEGDWLDLAALAPHAAVTGHEPPSGWEIEGRLPLLQYVGEDLAAAQEPAAVRLGAADVPEMMALAELTRPGPFLPRTIEMGAYLGIRRDGRLVAMAGERLRVPGYTEISAVCTHPDARGQALGTRLLLAVAHGIQERGETPFLHVLASNAGAIRLYEKLGFRLRLSTELLILTHSEAA